MLNAIFDTNATINNVVVRYLNIYLGMKRAADVFVKQARNLDFLKPFHSVSFMLPISDFPDHAIFREKAVNTRLVGQTWGFPLFEPM